MGTSVLAGGDASPVLASELAAALLRMWAAIAPVQALTAWFGASLAPHVSAANLSRIFAGALAVTGAAMLQSSMR